METWPRVIVQERPGRRAYTVAVCKSIIAAREVERWYKQSDPSLRVWVRA